MRILFKTMAFKKIIKNILNFFNLDIKFINKELKNLTFDQIYKKKIKSNPIIFDIGANQGQSIERFKKIFNNPIIHAFEPVDFEFKKLEKKYSKDKNIILNNCAVGDKNCYRDFNITAKTGNSSFNKITPDTQWLNIRSIQFKTSPENYTKDIKQTKIITLDNYCSENQIGNIDILKIDTQGYEDKVLEGAQEIMKKEIIFSIESEIMFDDVYEKYLTFSDLEKYLIPNNFRLVGINTTNNNLFSGIVFFADVLYFNKKKFKF